MIFYQNSKTFTKRKKNPGNHFGLSYLTPKIPRLKNPNSNPRKISMPHLAGTRELGFLEVKESEKNSDR